MVEIERKLYRKKYNITNKKDITDYKIEYFQKKKNNKIKMHVSKYNKIGNKHSEISSKTHQRKIMEQKEI